MEHFDGPRLDTGVWLPYYLPHWSSRAQSAATYTVAESELRLTIPREQGLWCPDDHSPIRVSGIQSALIAGQQPFADGLVIREDQPTHLGWTVHQGRIEVRARMELSERSMASVWMVGLEEPHGSGEICVFEVFGDAPDAIGMGIKPIGDPRLTWDFEQPRLDIDIASHHVYAADWTPGRVEFFVDGEFVRAVDQAPDYPLQFMVAVFDFPEKAPDIDHVPLFAVDSITA
ncbi:MAG TPA: glycoside hydrolase family 16 protein [Solirubrobacter sp.]|nr:glycoside hydrolase family 16 protein [Solirubrobacter sp.]